MTMQDRINKISQYFKGMNVDSESGIIYLTIIFPEKWSVNPQLLNQFNVECTAMESIKGGYYFYTNFNNGFDVLFDGVDCIINLNQQIQEKIDLLTAKINELKSLFQEFDISVLKTLKFVYKTKKNKAPKKEKPEIKTVENESIEKPENISEKESINGEIEQTTEEKPNVEHLKNVLSTAKKRSSKKADKH